MKASFNKKDIIYFCFFITFLILYFLIKLEGPSLIKNLYEQQSFGILNKIIHSQETKSLDYYQGEMENALWGPLKSIITSLLFLTFSLRYLRSATAFRFGVAVFIYGLISRPESLLYPPFGEGITGPFSDAVWLFQHKLDLLGLLKEETFTTGGPQIYPTALYPLFLASLMTILPSTKIFLIVLHLFYFYMAATILALLRFFALKTFLDEKKAVLITVLVLSLPLFQSMMELINLEMPTLFFTMLTAYYLFNNRLTAASLSSLGAIFVKDPGIIACIAIFIVGAMKFLTQEDPKKRLSIILWPAITIVVAATKSYLRNLIVGEQKNFNMVCAGCGWQNNRASPWFWLFILCLILLTIHAIIHLKRERYTLKSILSFSSLKNYLTLLTNQRFSPFIMFLISGLWFLLYNNFLTLAYRYQILLFPFVIFSICYVINNLIKKEKIISGLILFFIFVNLLSSHGLAYGNKTYLALFNFGLFKNPSPEKECYPTNLERSLEYRNYLQLEIKLAKEIEKNYAPYKIVAPFQTAQVLALPQLGYVDKKLDVTVYGMKATLGIKPFTGIKNLDLRKTVWVGFPHQYHEKIHIPYPIDPQDKILKKLEVGHIEVDIFMGGLAIEKMRRIIGLVQKKILQ